jgi:superfamily II DNA or RNA helicase
MKLAKLDPEKAYIGTNLLLPKKHIEEGPLVATLTFGIDKEGESVVLVKDHLHHFEVPRSAFTSDQLNLLGLEVVDLRCKAWTAIDLSPKPAFELRPRQKQAWDNGLRDSENGVLNMACGTGKTVLGWYKAAHCKVRTLVIAPQKAHLQAWVRELNSLFELKGTLGWIHGSSMEYDRDIVLATVQTLAKRAEQGGLPPDFHLQHGLVIFDEVHHMAAKWFSQAADLSMGNRLGLTATVTRINRDEGIFLSHIGPVFYADLKQDLKPIFYVVETGVAIPTSERHSIIDKAGNPNLGLIHSWLAKSQARNDAIQAILDQCIAENRCIYGLSHSVEQVQLFGHKNSAGGVITGSTPHDERLKVLDRNSLVFATMGVGGEAYNKPSFDTLVLMTPFTAHEHASPMFQQTVGRIQRSVPGKQQPKVFVFLDDIEEIRGLIFGLIAEAKRQEFEITWIRNTGKSRLARNKA